MTDHPRGRLVVWVLLALAGLAVAVALSVTASNLSTQPIGLQGEELRAGDRLAPPSVTRTTTKKAQPKPRKRKRSTETQTTPQPAPAPVPTTTTEDSGGGSGSSGGSESDDHGSGGHGSDD